MVVVVANGCFKTAKQQQRGVLFLPLLFHRAAAVAVKEGEGNGVLLLVIDITTRTTMGAWRLAPAFFVETTTTTTIAAAATVAAALTPSVRHCS